MFSRFFSLPRFLAVIAACSLSGLGFAASPLFLDAAADASRAAGSDDPGLVRSRQVLLDSAQLTEVTGATGSEVALNFFSDAEITVKFDRNEKPQPDALVAYGKVANDPLGTVTFSTVDDVTVGDVRLSDGRTFELRYAGNGNHVVRQIEENRTPPCGNNPETEEKLGLRVSAPPAPDAYSGAAPESDAAVPIDVMVIYTPQARTAAGGTSAIRAAVNLAMSYSNTSYINSAMSSRVNLVHCQELPYTEAGNLGTDLSRFTSTSDGYMDEVHTLRNIFKADMCALMTSSAAAGACGVAYLMTSVSSGFESACFSVTSRTCISNQSFQHELGHNQGCAHDAANAGSGAYSYSYGWLWQGTNSVYYRSVMAYDAAPGYQRVQHFSNPAVTYQGTATGHATQANNALTIDNTAPTVANFRTRATGPATIASLPTSFSPTIFQGQNAPATDFFVYNSGAGTINYTISDNVAWLDVSTASGSSSFSSNLHTITYSTTGLTAGTHNAQITVTDAGASNNPLVIPVTLTVNPPAPLISLNPTSLTPTVGQGSNAANQTFTVSNSGLLTLNYTVTDNVAWLSVSPPDGTSTGAANTHTITYSTSGLSAGTHNATITVADPAAGNNPQTIAVTLSVVVVPANDMFANATILSGSSGTVGGSSLNATRESGEPQIVTLDWGTNSGARSVWWRFVAPHTGSWQFSTIGSNFDTVLGIYTGNAVNALTWITGMDEGGPSNTSVASFSGTKDVEYKIAIDGYNGASGNIQLAWSSPSGPPAAVGDWTLY